MSYRIFDVHLFNSLQNEVFHIDGNAISYYPVTYIHSDVQYIENLWTIRHYEVEELVA